MFTKAEILSTIKRLKVDTRVISIPTIENGLRVELEHKDVTKGKIIPTMKIVIAHLKEFPDYYLRLGRMEKLADKHWKGKKKPKVLLSRSKK
jgi:Protein of unknown function (DUF5661)